MNEDTQKLVDQFLQNCKSVDIFGYTLGVFVAHKMDNENNGMGFNFTRDFYIFNGKNGIRFNNP